MLPNNPEKTLFEEQKDLANIEETKRNQARLLDAKKNVWDVLVQQLNAMKVEVDRMEGRQRAQQLLRLYHIAQVIKEAKDGKKFADQKQEEVDKATLQLQIAKKTIEPLEQLERELKKKQTILNKNDEEINTKVRGNETKMKRKKEKVEESEGIIIEAKNELNLIDEVRKRDEGKLSQYEKELEKHQKILITVSEKLPEINRLMSESKSRISELSVSESSLNEEMGDLNDQLLSHQDTIRKNIKKITELKDSKQLFRQKLNYLLNSSNNDVGRNIRDAINVMDHLDRESEHLQRNGVLRGEVYGPVAMYLKVSSPVCAVILEKCIPQKRWYSFLCTCDGDSDYIKNYMKSNNIYLDVFTMKNLELPKPNLSNNYLENNLGGIGMVGYISREIIDCPDIIRSFMYMWHGVHNVLWAEKTENCDSISDRHYTLLCPENVPMFRLYVHNVSTRNDSNLNIMEYNGSKSRYTNKMSTRGNTVSVKKDYQSLLHCGGEVIGDKRSELENIVNNAQIQKDKLSEIYNDKNHLLENVKGEINDLKRKRGEYQKVQSLPQVTQSNIVAETKRIKEMQTKLSKNVMNEKNEKLSLYSGAIEGLFKNISGTISLCGAHTALLLESTAAGTIRSHIAMELGGIVDQIMEGREGLGAYEKAVQTAQNER